MPHWLVGGPHDEGVTLTLQCCILVMGIPVIISKRIIEVNQTIIDIMYLLYIRESINA